MASVTYYILGTGWFIFHLHVYNSKQTWHNNPSQKNLICKAQIYFYTLLLLSSFTPFKAKETGAADAGCRLMKWTGLAKGKLKAAGLWPWPFPAAMARVFTWVIILWWDSIDGASWEEQPVSRDADEVKGTWSTSRTLIKLGGEGTALVDKRELFSVRACGARRSAVGCCWVLWFLRPCNDL